MDGTSRRLKRKRKNLKNAEKYSPISEEMDCFGTPEGTRTPDLLVRR
jgi:hypothetical protein